MAGNSNSGRKCSVNPSYGVYCGEWKNQFVKEWELATAEIRRYMYKQYKVRQAKLIKSESLYLK